MLSCLDFVFDFFLDDDDSCSGDVLLEEAERLRSDDDPLFRGVDDCPLLLEISLRLRFRYALVFGRDGSGVVVVADTAAAVAGVGLCVPMDDVASVATAAVSLALLLNIVRRDGGALDKFEVVTVDASLVVGVVDK